MQSPKQTAQALNKVLYGRAPEEAFEHLLKDSPSAGIYNSNNMHDQAFADFLEDHEDPRAIIVKRDLGYRVPSDTVNGMNWNDNYTRHGANILGVDPDNLDSDILKGSTTTFGMHVKKHKNKKAYQAYYRPKGGNFLAYLTKDEAKPIIDEFGLEE